MALIDKLLDVGLHDHDRDPDHDPDHDRGLIMSRSSGVAGIDKACGSVTIGLIMRAPPPLDCIPDRHRAYYNHSLLFLYH
jgi:hypothetical protein